MHQICKWGKQKPNAQDNMKLACMLSLILVKFLHRRTNELYKVAVLQNWIFKGVGEIEFKIFLFIKGKPKRGVERKYSKL